MAGFSLTWTSTFDALAAITLSSPLADGRGSVVRQTGATGSAYALSRCCEYGVPAFAAMSGKASRGSACTKPEDRR